MHNSNVSELATRKEKGVLQQENNEFQHTITQLRKELQNERKISAKVFKEKNQLYKDYGDLVKVVGSRHKHTRTYGAYEEEDHIDPFKDIQQGDSEDPSEPLVLSPRDRGSTLQSLGSTHSLESLASEHQTSFESEEDLDVSVSSAMSSKIPENILIVNSSSPKDQEQQTFIDEDESKNVISQHLARTVMSNRFLQPVHLPKRKPPAIPK